MAELEPSNLPKPGDETLPLNTSGPKAETSGSSDANESIPPAPKQVNTHPAEEPQILSQGAKVLDHAETVALSVWGQILNDNQDLQDPTATLKGAVTVREDPSWLKTLQSVTIAIAGQTDREDGDGDLNASNYILGKAIGEGGMGVVYEARQRNLRRDVALKMLQPRLEEEPELVEQFVVEAMITGRLEHPNIVPVHDLGRTADDRLFMGMKLVRGESLKALLKREPADNPQRLRDTLDILSQICDAMAYAHSKGIVHRDLKPENVMVGEFGEVQVMDWGLAFAYGNHGLPDSHNLAGVSSGPSGTPAYMSPEQVKGNDQEIGSWSDVYLLGAILYEILTGTPPHRGQSIMAVLLAAQDGVIERPSDRAPTRDIPYDLEELCIDALKAHRAERLQNVQDFQDRLQLYQSHREALGLIDRARQILGSKKEGSEAGDAYKQAQWTLEQALGIWPESQAALALLNKTLLQQIDRFLEIGQGADAHHLVGQLKVSEELSPKRIKQLDRATLRQMSKRRNHIATVLGLMIIFSFAGHWLVRLIARLQADDRRTFARDELPSRTAAAWAALDKDDRDIDQTLGRLKKSLDATGWQLTQSDYSHLLAAVAWDSLRVGDLGRASRTLAPLLDENQQHELEFLRKDGRTDVRPAQLLSGWQQKSVTLPPTVRRVSDALLLAAISRRSLDSAKRAELTKLMIKTGARSVLSDQRSGIIQALLQNPDTAIPIRFYQNAKTGRVVAIDVSTKQRLWTFPPALETRDLPWRPRSPLLLEKNGGFSLVLGWGSDVLSLDPKNGRILKRLRLHDACVGLLPAGNSRFYVIQPARWGACHSRLVEAGAEGWVDRPLPGADVTVLWERQRWILGGIENKGDRRAPDDKGRLREELIRLKTLQKRDPSQAIWTHHSAIRHQKLGDTSSADKLFQQLLKSDLSAFEKALLAVDWKKAGDEQKVEALILSALKTQVDRGANPDLNTNLDMNPAVLIRNLAEEYRASNKAFSKTLLGYSRELATTLEGDRFPFLRGRSWLVEDGQFRDKKERQQYRARAIRLGGFFFSPPGSTKVFDLVLLFSILTPTFLFASMFILYLRSFHTQREELRSLGFRTEWSRWAAFFTHPALRWSHTFLAYTNRHERIFLLLGGLFNLFTKVFIATILAAVTDVANMPPVLGRGYLGHPTIESFIENSREQGATRESAPHLRLLVEAALSRHEYDRAATLLDRLKKIEPSDGFALNNSGYLAEKRGQQDLARDFYQKAGANEGEDGQVGRYNLARLGKLPRPDLSVTYKSFLRFYQGSNEPLRQYARSVDFLNVVNLGPSLLSVMAKKVGAVNDGGRHLTRLIAALERRGLVGSAGDAPQALRYFTLLPSFFIFLSLILILHLPFGTRPIANPLGERGQGALLRISRIGNLMLPGVIWLFRGRIIMGSIAMLLVPLLAFGIWRGSHPGLLESFAFPQMPDFFNTTDLTELTVSQGQRFIGGGAALILFVLYPAVWFYGYKEWHGEIDGPPNLLDRNDVEDPSNLINNATGSQ
jgi:serine/threonine protein kinase